MKELYKAIASVQQEVEPIIKDTTGYGYKYADIVSVWDKTLPALKKHGLGFTQPLAGIKLKTIIFHIESGESIESIVDIPQGVELKGMNDFQVLGSAITYLRRYSLASTLGLITDEDNDAHGEQKKKYVSSQTKLATDKQKYFINNLLQQNGIDTDSRKEYLATEFGVLDSSKMSEADASMIIETLDNPKVNNAN